jgi:SGNH domain (fused to AT3 domains)
MRFGRSGRVVVVGVVLSLVAALSGTALASPYTTVSRLPGVPAVLSWILHSGSTKSLSPALQAELQKEPKSMFWADPCAGNPNKAASATACAFGDTSASQSIVLYGDSFALQWVPALNELGIADHFKVLVYVRIGCPFADKAVRDYLGSVDSGCLPYRAGVVSAINSMRPAPQLVLAAEDFYKIASNGSGISSRQWAAAVAKSLSQLAVHRIPVGVVLGTPAARYDPSQCLAAHPSKVLACNTPIASAFSKAADSRFATAIRGAHAFVVNVSMLMCGNSCPDILHNTLVHADRWHLSASYVQALGRSFGSLVGCVGTRASRGMVPSGGVLDRLLAPSSRITSACKAAIIAPFNL